MDSNQALAARSQLSPFDGTRNEKPPTIGMVTIQAKVNYAQLTQQYADRKGVYEKVVPSIRTTGDDLSLHPGQIAFCVKNQQAEEPGYPFVQTSLNGFNGLAHENGLDTLYEELLTLFPRNTILAQSLITHAIMRRIYMVGYLLESSKFLGDDRLPRNSNATTSVVTRGLIGVHNHTNVPMNAGQSVKFRPMTFDEADRLDTSAAHHVEGSRVRPRTVGLIAVTEDYKSLSARQQELMRLFLADSELFARLFDVAGNRIGRCELLACVQIVRGQMLQGAAFTAKLMDAGIIILNPVHAADSIHDQMQGPPHMAVNPAIGNLNRAIEARTDAPDMLMFSKQMLGPFYTNTSRQLLWPSERTSLDTKEVPSSVGAYKSLLFLTQLCEMLHLIKPSERNEPNNQFAGVTRQWLSNRDNRQAALTLGDELVRCMNLVPSNEFVQGLAHEPGAYLVTRGENAVVDNQAYTSSLTSGMRVANMSTAAGRVLRQMQLASSMVSLGHAQIFAADAVQGVVTQPAGVHGMAHVFLGGGNGRL